MTKFTATVLLAAAQALAAAIAVSAATVTTYATDTPVASGAYVSPETEPMTKAAPYVLTTTTAPHTATTAAPVAADPYKKNCYASGERNQGAVGHSHIKLMPCCVEGEYGQAVDSDWGRFCLPAPTTGSSGCYGPGERTVLYRPCCDGQAARPKAGDWGKFCPDCDGDANDDDSVECYGPGERSQASRGYPAVPFKPCCDGQAARSKSGNWGMFCPDGVSCTQGEAPSDGSCCPSDSECPTSFGNPQEQQFQGYDWNRKSMLCLISCPVSTSCAASFGSCVCLILHCAAMLFLLIGCIRACYWWGSQAGSCRKKRKGSGSFGGGGPPSDCRNDTEPGKPDPPGCPDDIDIGSRSAFDWNSTFPLPSSWSPVFFRLS